MVLDSILHGLRALVVDDDPDSCNLMTFVLQDYGLNVQCVLSVQDALQAFENFRPDILISDIAMPQEDGYSLIQKIALSSVFQGQEILAIATTALVNDEVHERVLSAGFHEWLPKPFDIDQLMEMITVWANLRAGL